MLSPRSQDSQHSPHHRSGDSLRKTYFLPGWQSQSTDPGYCILRFFGRTSPNAFHLISAERIMAIAAIVSIARRFFPAINKQIQRVPWRENNFQRRDGQPLMVHWESQTKSICFIGVRWMDDEDDHRGKCKRQPTGHRKKEMQEAWMGLDGRNGASR